MGRLSGFRYREIIKILNLLQFPITLEICLKVL